MKKTLFLFLLFVGIVGCQNENESLLSEDSEIAITTESGLKKIFYKNKEYSIEEASALLIDNRILIQFDFRQGEGFLFDNKSEAIEYSNIFFKDQHSLIQNFLSDKEESAIDLKDKVFKSQDRAGKILSNGYGLNLVDRSCSAPPPYQIFAINLDVYPSGSIVTTAETGYLVKSFDITVPTGGSIAVGYFGPGNKACLTNMFVATVSQCYDVTYPFTCSGSRSALVVHWIIGS